MILLLSLFADSYIYDKLLLFLFDDSYMYDKLLLPLFADSYIYSFMISTLNHHQNVHFAGLKRITCLCKLSTSDHDYFQDSFRLTINTPSRNGTITCWKRMWETFNRNYSKTCVKQPLKYRQSKIFMTNGSLIKIERSILQNFWPALIDSLEDQFLVFLRVTILHKNWFQRLSRLIIT